MYVFKLFEFVINLLLYAPLNLNFKLRHVDFYYLVLINNNVKFESKSEVYLNKMSIKNICTVLSMML